MMRVLGVALLLFSGCYAVTAQVKRNYSDGSIAIEIWAQNNRMENNFSFPGMSAFIIVGDQSLANSYGNDRLRRMPVSGMNDYACFYYLKADDLRRFASLKSFLKGFIDECYRSDFIDRNALTLVWECKDSDVIPCDSFNNLDTVIAGIYILNEAVDMDCSGFAAPSADYVWQKSKNARTVIPYPIPSLLDMELYEEQEQQKRNAASYSKKRGDIFFQATAGRHDISNSGRTGFDTGTLVDFTRFKTLWNIHAGYYITNRLFVNAELAFIYSGKKKQVDSIDWNGSAGITVTGSGYAGAMFRYGLGIGWLPYSNRRFDMVTNISIGRLNAMAGGGGGTKTVGSGSSNMDIVKEKRQTGYCNLLIGFNYHLSSLLYFTGNFQYKYSTFDRPIGSVSAFTGWSVNAGLGIMIPTKNKDNDKK